MKLFLSFLICTGILSTQAFTQTTNDSQPVEKKSPAFYIGIGTGVNSTTGLLGVKVEALVCPQILMGLGVGYGTWGPKASLNAYYQTESGWCPMIGFSRSAGLDSSKQNLKVIEKGVEIDKDVVMTYKAETLINLGLQKQWFTQKGHRIYLELGYAFGFDSDPYILWTPGVKLTQKSNQAVRLMSPGGLIIGAGFCFKIK